MTVMGDALMEGLSDAGSIPARSIKKDDTASLPYHLFLFVFYFFFNTNALLDGI